MSNERVGPQNPTHPPAQEGEPSQPPTARMEGSARARDQGLPAHEGSLDPSTLPFVDDDRYIVEGEYARGGLGRILKARDPRLARPVAIKELLQNDKETAARFMREALVSARLQHPAIVPIYEAGRWPSGEMFYAMKLISGRSLDQVIEETRHLDERLGLLPHIIAVADAMAYAHSQKVIHRDLKPANILIGPFGETVIIDWGLAKDLTEPEPERVAVRPRGPGRGPVTAPTLTADDAILGTPEYMPPEQTETSAVDERADVYALGAMLYHLLAGVLPYSGGSSDEVLVEVRRGPPRPLAERDTGIPRDLVTIVDKAMARRPEDRYPSARELAEDLRRFQTGQMVSARQYSRITLLGRWLSRHRVPAAFLFVLAVLGGLSVRRIVHERSVAEARGNQLILVQARTSLKHDPTMTLTWLKVLPAGAVDQTTMRNLALDAFSRGVARHVFRKGEGKESYGAFSPDSRLVAVMGPERTLQIRELETGQPQYSLRIDGELQLAKFSPDGKTLAFTEWESSTLKLWDLASDALRDLSGHDGAIYNFEFSPDGRMLLVGSTGPRLRLWTLASGDAQILEDHEGIGSEVRFSPDGQLIMYPGKDHTIHLVEVQTGRPRVFRGTETPLSLEFSPDGQQLVSAGEAGTIWLWDVATGIRRALTGHSGTVKSAVFSPDGKQVASASFDRTIRLWDVATGQGRILGEHQSEAFWVSFSKDGQVLASSSWDTTVRLWWPATGDQRTLMGHSGTVYQVVFSPGGQEFMTISADRTTRIWTLPPDPSRVLRRTYEGIKEVAYSRDGRHLVLAGRDGVVLLWDTRTGGFRCWAGHQGIVSGVAFSPDGRTVASASLDQTVRLWDVATGQSRVLQGHEGLVWRVTFSPDGKLVASSGVDGTVRLWEVATGKGRILRGHEREVRSLAFSPDGQLLASAGADRTVRLWETASGAVRVLRGHDQPIFRVVFSHNGRWVASASGDGTMRLWNVATGQGRVMSRQQRRVRAVAFSPDDRLVATSGEDALVKVCDVGTETCRTLAGHGDWVSQIDFSPDGQLVASSSGDGTVRVWGVRSGACHTIHRHDGVVNDVVFSPDGAQLASASMDKTARLWRVDSTTAVPRDPMAFRGWLSTITSDTIPPDSDPAEH